jgi:hypothetical protein
MEGMDSGKKVQSGAPLYDLPIGSAIGIGEGWESTMHAYNRKNKKKGVYKGTKTVTHI